MFFFLIFLSFVGLIVSAFCRVVCQSTSIEDVFFVLGAWCFSSATTSSLWSSTEAVMARELVKVVGNLNSEFTRPGP